MQVQGGETVPWRRAAEAGLCPVLGLQGLAPGTGQVLPASLWTDE